MLQDYIISTPRVIIHLAQPKIVSILYGSYHISVTLCWPISVFQITASPSARSRQLWRRTGNFLEDFLQFYVYDLRIKAGGLTTFLTEFWTLPICRDHSTGVCAQPMRDDVLSLAEPIPRIMVPLSPNNWSPMISEDTISDFLFTWVKQCIFQWLISSGLVQKSFQWFNNSPFDYDYLHQLWKYIDPISTKMY